MKYTNLPCLILHLYLINTHFTQVVKINVNTTVKSKSLARVLFSFIHLLFDK